MLYNKQDENQIPQPRKETGNETAAYKKKSKYMEVIMKN